LLRAVGDFRRVAECLEGLASLARVRGALDRAARLFAASAVLRETLGTPLTPQEQAHRAANVAALNATVRDEGMAAAWAEGRRLDADHAVHALDGLAGDLPAQPVR
jgi:hypothetical protein